MSNIDLNRCLCCGGNLKDKEKYPTFSPWFTVTGYKCKSCNEKIKKDRKTKLVENLDTIALFSVSFISAFVVYAGILPDKNISTLILIVLTFLAGHHLLRTFKIEKMHKQIEMMCSAVKTFTNKTELLEKMGIMNINSKRSEIPVNKLNEEASKAAKFFVLSRYFQAFERRNVKEATRQCLNNGGIVQIIIYAPKGHHLEVEIESDITSDEASHRISETLRRLRIFKQELSPDAQKRFQYKILENYVIYTNIFGMPNKIYATNYLNNLKGEECPTIVCRSNDGSNDLYSIYLEEFERLWKVASEDNIEPFKGVK